MESRKAYDEEFVERERILLLLVVALLMGETQHGQGPPERLVICHVTNFSRRRIVLLGAKNVDNSVF